MTVYQHANIIITNSRKQQLDKIISDQMSPAAAAVINCPHTKQISSPAQSNLVGLCRPPLPKRFKVFFKASTA